MILVSAGLVLTAIVLLIAGFVLGQAYLVMWSIAISLLSAVFLVIGALLRRHELFPGGHAGAAPAFPQKGPVPAGPLPAPHMMPNQTSPHPPQMMMPRGMQQTATVAAQPRLSPMARPVPAARQGPLDDGAIVLVIPGRKRYHVAGCRQLVGRDHEELTHEEAREEGFTPCTTCLPESIAGAQPQDAPAGAQEPVKPLGQVASSQESSSSGASREPGHHEATARFTSPYKPVASPAGQETSSRQESPLAGQEISASGQETVVPPAKPYAHPPAAQTPPSESGRTRSQEPGETRPQEPVNPPPRTGQSAVPSFSFLSPSIPEIPPAESEATSWFNRDAVAPAESGTEAPANPDPELVKPGSPAESEPATRKPAEPGSPTAAESSTGSEASARSETSADQPETPEPVKPEAAGSKSAKPEASGSQAVKPETAESESAESETASAKGAAPEASSEVKRKAPAVPAPAEPADDVAEPVESAETASGRAGQPVPADLTPAESAAAEPDEAAVQSAQKAQERVPFEDRDDDDTSPGGIPVIWDRPGSADPEAEPDQEAEPDRETESGPKREAVKVIAGTRRFHDSDCPLIKGMGGSGVETMSQSEAEDAGLTSCPVCLSDH
ncbi:hypothetical protein SAMN05216276_1004162 [Streptosporangium subroseum]|uniref:Uncharacterized protein n=1 Tax=Streptosporangium subroseum TaxID=106412 RepID=A0A239BX05_9ACTN|nr:hypothetical protein [Streptosporangium subroseum]SNS11968.1 hypothetical protein SAMN05216276_1004162 [Streptosporangium subroseum]